MNLKIKLIISYFLGLILSFVPISCMQQIQKPAIVYQQQQKAKERKDRQGTKNVQKDTKSDQPSTNKPISNTVQNTQTNTTVKSTDAKKSVAKNQPKDHIRYCPTCDRLSSECVEDQERISRGAILPCACRECRKDPFWIARFTEASNKYYNYR